MQFNLNNSSINKIQNEDNIYKSNNSHNFIYDYKHNNNEINNKQMKKSKINIINNNQLKLLKNNENSNLNQFYLV